MAMMADSSSGIHSGDLASGHQSMRKDLQWNQLEQLSLSGEIIVSSPPAAAADGSTTAEKSEGGDNAAAAKPKNLAWNKPSDGAVEANPVMGAALWPALKESTETSFSKDVPDESVPSSSQGPIIQNVPSAQEASTSAGPNSARTWTTQAQPRLGGGGGGLPIQRGFPHPPSPPPLYYPPPGAFTGFGPPMPNYWETRPVEPYNPNPYTRGGYGPPGNYGGNYRANYRGNYYGNYVNERDSAGRFGRAPNAPPFCPPYPPAYVPYGHPTWFHGYMPQLPLETYSGIPFFAHGPSLPPLVNQIVDQIDYYFSDDNLATDAYLRSHMDAQGWVPVSLIAGFRRVKRLTNDIQLILDSMKHSDVVEVQDAKFRKRHGWIKWLNHGVVPQ